MHIILIACGVLLAYQVNFWWSCLANHFNLFHESGECCKLSSILAHFIFLLPGTHNTIAGKMYYLHSCSLRTGNIPVLGITLYPAHSIIGSEKRHILTYIYEYIISCLSYFRDYALFILSFPIGVT